MNPPASHPWTLIAQASCGNRNQRSQQSEQHSQPTEACTPSQQSHVGVSQQQEAPGSASASTCNTDPASKSPNSNSRIVSARPCQTECSFSAVAQTDDGIVSCIGRVGVLACLSSSGPTELTDGPIARPSQRLWVPQSVAFARRFHVSAGAGRPSVVCCDWIAGGS